MALPVFHLPKTLKLAQLNLIATKCGIPSSGTKPVLLSRIHHEITTLSALPRTQTTRILSIDMGIRNLAYCLLEVPPKKSSISKPDLTAWQRLAVSSAPKKSVDEDGTEDKVVTKEAFDPATLSKIAYTLLRDRLLKQNPTHVLIERQRFRSMGSKHILEWTIRVNMFESILYATLHTLKAEGVWGGEVVPIIPGKVGPFWIEEDMDSSDPVTKNEGQDKPKERKGKIRKTASAKLKNKGAKIDLVRSWLENGDMVGIGNEDVQKIVSAYSEKWDRAPGGVKGKRVPKSALNIEERMGKLDDLADCLLQGMAWIGWEENKRKALTHGVEVLLN